MDFLRRLFLYVGIVSLLALLIGLYRPWVTLWWEDMQTRRKVIKLYGTVAVASYCAYWILTWIIESRR